MKDKLSLKEKISYGCGDFACQLSWQVVSSYLLVFYTDVFGLAPAVISIIMLVARVWDAVNDPMMGLIVERTHSKWGRFRPYLLFTAPIMALFNILTFWGPDLSGNLKIGYALITYIGLGMAYTAINIPYQGLAAVMTKDGEERNAINMWRTIGMNVGALLINMTAMRLISSFSEKGLNGYLATVCIYSLAAIPIFWIVFANCKERYIPEKTQKIKISDSFHAVMQNKPLMILLLQNLFSNVSMNIRLGTLAYYFIYVVGNPILMATLLPLEICCAIVVTPIGVKLANKYGNKKVMIIANIVHGIAIALFFIVDPTNTPLLMLTAVLVGVTNCYMALPRTLLLETIDYAEEKIGVNASGIISAAGSMMEKVSLAIAGSGGVLMLAAFGYVANAQQTALSITGIKFTSQLFPAICYLICAFIMLFYNLEQTNSADE